MVYAFGLKNTWIAASTLYGLRLWVEKYLDRRLVG
jgi:hypothetical protein